MWHLYFSYNWKLQRSRLHNPQRCAAMEFHLYGCTHILICGGLGLCDDPWSVVKFHESPELFIQLSQIDSPRFDAAASALAYSFQTEILFIYANCNLLSVGSSCCWLKWVLAVIWDYPMHFTTMDNVYSMAPKWKANPHFFVDSIMGAITNHQQCWFEWIVSRAKDNWIHNKAICQSCPAIQLSIQFMPILANSGQGKLN